MKKNLKEITAKIVICLLVLGSILSTGIVSFARPDMEATVSETVADDMDGSSERQFDAQPADETMEAAPNQEHPAVNEPEDEQNEQADTAVEVIGIATLEDLCKIGNDEGYPLDGIYEVSEDIAGTGEAFRPIGSAQAPFTGVLRGGGHAISGLRISGDDAGLFAGLGGRVENLALVDITVQGGKQAGVLAGKVTGTAVIENVYLSGSVTGGKSGGMAGTIESAAAISAVQVAARVSGADETTGAVAGKCSVPADVFLAVVWSDVCGTESPFGNTSPQQEGPFTVVTEPLALNLIPREQQEVKAPGTAAGLSFVRWENMSGAFALSSEDASATTVTAGNAAQDASLAFVYANASGREIRFEIPVNVRAAETAPPFGSGKETFDLLPVFPVQLTVPEAVDSVFPTVLSLGAGASPSAADTTPPDATLILSHFYHRSLRNEVEYTPDYKEFTYFWDTNSGGTLLEDGILYRYTKLLAPDEINFDMVSPVGAAICFSVVMSDGESGLATKDFDGTVSPYFDYYLSETPLTEEQLKRVPWLPIKQYDTAYGYNAIQGHWIIYVRVMDKAGNAAYISSNGYTQDNDGPVMTDVSYTAENETADGWARSRTVSFRLEDPVLGDGTPGCGLDENKTVIQNTTASSSSGANISGYGFEVVNDGGGAFHVKADILPMISAFSVTAHDKAVNPDFEEKFRGPNVRQNKGIVLDKIDSEAPKAENLTQAPAEWSRTKTISVNVRDIAMEMDWDLGIDDGGNVYTFPVPAEDGEIDGSGIAEVFLSEDQNAQPDDPNNIALASAMLNAGGARAVSATVDHNGTYYMITTDNVGNRAEYPITVTTIDTTLPVVMEVTHTPPTTADGYLSETDFTLHVTGISDEKEPGTAGTVEELWYGTENDAAKAAKVDSYVAGGGTCSIPVTPPDGAVTYYVWAKDAFGNFSEPTSTTIYKDTQPPVMGQPYTDPAGWTNKAEVTLCVPDVIDAESGVQTVLFADHPIVDATDGTEMTLSGNTAMATIAPATDGVYTYYFRAVDRAGNIGVEKQVMAYIDRSAPTGSIREGKNVWQSFLAVITFGQQHKESTTFTIEAQETKPEGIDQVSGVATIDYYVRETDPRADTLTETLDQFMEASKDWEWVSYTPFSDVAIPFDTNAKRVIYARIADKAGNITYINSEGLAFGGVQQSATDRAGIPKTGDQTVPVWIYLSVILAAVIVIVAVVIIMRKKKERS